MLDGKHKSSYLKGMANVLPPEKRALILQMMVEGSSMRSISRVAGVSINTVAKLLVDAGEACLKAHDDLVKDVHAKRVECDEIWSFVHTKERNKGKAKDFKPEHGDVWTWTAIEADTKLIISYLAGTRTMISAEAFLTDLASRLADRVQIDTDGHAAYVPTIRKVFEGKIDHAVITKVYANVKAEGQKRYAPLECVGVKKKAECGTPDMRKASTSYVERQNLSMRMGMRRFTRLTNGHSKKYEQHLYALALYFMHYNFCRKHQSLGMTPAMAAGLTDTQHDMAWIVEKIEENAPPPKKRGPYKKKA
ncbi:transposase [Hyphomonas adhaerens]|nr:transposase [Hyphomonas adhaerens]